jgi:hypothetical protein
VKKQPKVEKLPLQLPPLPSVAIQRIIDEVKLGDKAPTGYNRTYHRHNR